MLDAPARPEESYDELGSSSTMFIGASAPRSAGHFANGTVSTRQNQVKDITAKTLGLIDSLEKGGEDVGLLLVELDVQFQELDLGLLFTDQEKVECSRAAAGKRREQIAPAALEGGAAKPADLEGMKAQIAQWMKEQLERKRKLYKVETMVRDLGVNVNDVRCQRLEEDRRRALVKLKESTDTGVRILREVMETLKELGAASAP